MTGTLDVKGLTDINNFHMNSVLYFLMLLKNIDEKFDAKAFFLFSRGFPFKKNSSFLTQLPKGESEVSVRKITGNHYGRDIIYITATHENS